VELFYGVTASTYVRASKAILISKYENTSRLQDIVALLCLIRRPRSYCFTTLETFGAKWTSRDSKSERVLLIVGECWSCQGVGRHRPCRSGEIRRIYVINIL
jgi:hypothetical protein